MVKKDKNSGIFFIALGLLVVLAMFNMNDGREAKPSFDGQRDYFSLSLQDHAERAEANDLYWVDVRVTNTKNEGGSMYVQCSILDRDQQEWLAGLQSVTMLDTNDNCVDDEPFTQIGQVTLEGLKYSDVRFTFQVPNTPNGDNVIWCEAFEQCWSEGQDETMSSDYIIEPITVVAADTNPNNNVGGGDMCEFDSECKKFWFIGDQVCVEGYCVDPADAAPDNTKQFEIPDIDAKGWASDNKISIVFVGLILVLVGSMFIYKKPKQPKYY